MAGRGLSYTEQEAKRAISTSYSWAESLRKLGLCPTGGGWRVLKKYAALWEISTEHFDPRRAGEGNLRNSKRPLMCGQDENWRGRRMAMILDHINGVRNDHRLENLRIVCPNCAATLDTHCGRKNRMPPVERNCRRCQRRFFPSRPQQRYCSRACGSRWDRSKLRGAPNPEARKVGRPPYERLITEIEATSYCAVGRKYGVSDNAVRKWVRFYERERERGAYEASG
jgi:hypothetical protein